MWLPPGSMQRSTHPEALRFRHHALPESSRDTRSGAVWVTVSRGGWTLGLRPSSVEGAEGGADAMLGWIGGLCGGAVFGWLAGMGGRFGGGVAAAMLAAVAATLAGRMVAELALAGSALAFVVVVALRRALEVRYGAR